MSSADFRPPNAPGPTRREDSHSGDPRPATPFWLGAVRDSLERYQLVALCGLCGLALFWPDRWLARTLPPLAAGLADPFEFLANPTLLNRLFAVTMFAVGTLLPRDEVADVVRQWPSTAGGTCVQYLSMPLIALGIAYLFGFTGATLWGVFLVGCVPGAMASNVLTLVARGNVSYSLSLTTLATLASPLFVPWALWWGLGTTVEIPVAATSIKLLWMVVGPVVAGHLLARFAEGVRRWAAVISPSVANVAILWVIAAVVARNRVALQHPPGQLVLALLAINGLGYLAGWSAGRLLRLDVSRGRALTLEIGMQNAGLGAVLANDLFHDTSQAALPPALYTFGCMFTGTLLARWWSRRPLREAWQQG